MAILDRSDQCQSQCVASFQAPTVTSSSKVSGTIFSQLTQCQFAAVMLLEHRQVYWPFELVAAQFAAAAVLLDDGLSEDRIACLRWSYQSQSEPTAGPDRLLGSLIPSTTPRPPLTPA